MTDAGLLAAIRAAPHEDGPRAVYADALLARDDPRGEFIAVQLRLAALEGALPLSDAQKEEGDRLMARQTELGERFGRAAPNVRAFLHRGFARRVLLGANGEAELLTDPLFRHVLGEAVIWQSSPERVRALTSDIGVEHVALLHHVVFNGTVGVDASDAIAEWGPLARLDTLHFLNSELGLEGLGTILRAPRTTAITRLSVFRDSLTGIGRWLVDVCPAVVELDLNFAELSVADVAAITRTEHLRSLSLSGNRFGDAGAELLARSTTLENLQSLDLSSCGLTSAGHRALATGALPRHLRLILEREDVDPHDADALRARFDRVEL